MIIEQRVEGKAVTPNYSEHKLSESEIAAGKHRQWVGGHWDDGHGKTQVDYLIQQGLRPHHKVIDIGCGSLRGGRYFVDYLDSGNYFGVDANLSVIEAGYQHELTDEQRQKLPSTNLLANDRFDARIGGQTFDYALAQSVFTHVSLNQIRLCLYRLAQSMAPGGTFYATFFEEGAGRDLDYIRVSPKAKQRFSDRNVFWYYRSDLEWAASFSPWRMRYIGDWGHPARQKMVEFTRTRAATGRRSTSQPGRQPTIVLRGRRWLARQIAP
jgi:SAM-dependent methyltransferase